MSVYLSAIASHKKSIQNVTFAYCYLELYEVEEIGVFFLAIDFVN